MVEHASIQKKAVANACRNLHLYTYDIRPRFLRRNIKHILDSHARALRQTSEAGAGSHEDMVANAKRDWGWDFPTTEMVEDFVNGEKPLLQIESLHLRAPGSKVGLLQRPQRATQEGNGDGLGWLPDPQIDASWPCTVSIALSRPQNSRQKSHCESIPAKVLQMPGSCRHADFEVKFARPVFLEVDDLFAVLDSGKTGQRSWKRTITTPYLLELAIQCQDSDDSADLLGRLESKNVSSYENTPSSEGVLKATWEQLPTCPSKYELLTIRRPQGHKSLELGYKMQVAMGWITRQEHRLRTYNKLFQTKKDEIRQLPTPSASDDMEKSVKRFRINWKFRDSSENRAFELEGLSCPFCNEQKDYVYIDRLMLHCRTHHSHFDFYADYETDQPDSPTFIATILVSIPHHVERQDEEDERDMNWVAPNRPFDISAHVRGEDNWTGQARLKSRRGAGKHQRDNRNANVAPPLMQPSRKRPAPEEVDDLPRHQPKRHCVPYVPGVSFYHTTSKQEIQAGEAVTESDDEVDESWLTQSQDRALVDLGLTDAAKDFASAFNQHLASEQSDSSVLVRDALIRFTRKHREQLRHVEWQRLFRAKLNQLRAVGIIGDDIVSACVSFMQAGRERRVNGEIPRATSAGAQDDRKGTSDTSKHKNAVNGVTTTSQSSKESTINGVRSASPGNGDTRSKEVRKGNSGKAAMNGSIASRTSDSPEENERSPDGDRTTQRPEAKGTRKPAQAARKAACLCGISAKDARASIACADPVSH